LPLLQDLSVPVFLALLALLALLEALEVLVLLEVLEVLEVPEIPEILVLLALPSRLSLHQQLINNLTNYLVFLWVQQQ
jgi:hypothetical protein